VSVPRRLRTVGAAVAVGALASGCGQGILGRKGSESDKVANVWWLMFGLAAAVYLVVAGCILFAAMRGRRRRSREPRLHETAFIWIGGVIVPAVILAVLAVVTVRTTSALRDASPGELRVDVAGKLWWWEVRYPGTGVASANEIHLPQGRPVRIHLTSDNVIHSFWVPELAGKMDTIPGQPNDLRFTAEKVGRYQGVCAEYCGLQHAHMAVDVIVQTPAEFGRWLAQQRQPPLEPASEEAATGQVIFQREACAGCHTIRGTTATGKVGPDLTDLGARRTLGAGAALNTRPNLEHWIRDPEDVKPGVLMPSFGSLSDHDVAALAAYLESLE
jgi:cytochrome c oxidase subunit 2